jgi:hypothetical protein
MAVEIDKGTVASAAWEADLDIEKAIRWSAKGCFRGYHTSDFFALIGQEADLAKFFLQLGLLIGEDPENNIDISDAMEIADSIVVDNMGRSDLIYGFPAASVKEED